MWCSKGIHFLPLSCGVPKGFTFGCLLFILYINDIAHISKTVEFILFADDTNLFMSDKCLDSLINIINIEITKILPNGSKSTNSLLI